MPVRRPSDIFLYWGWTLASAASTFLTIVTVSRRVLAVSLLIVGGMLSSLGFVGRAMIGPGRRPGKPLSRSRGAARSAAAQTRRRQHGRREAEAGHALW